VVTTLSRGYMLMVVSASSPVKSVKEFIDLAKSEPGKLTFGSGSSSSRVGGELFRQLAGVDLIHVQYKSNPQAQVDLMGGQLDLVFSDTSSTLPHVRSEKLRALAVTGPQRLEELPDIPTVAEAGVPGYEVSYWTGLYLPAGAPQAIVDRLHEIFIEANASPAMVRQRALTMSEAFVMSPAEMVRFQAAESEKWGKIIRAAGIEPQ
jgi:tripartite-type tricarboxylate transporter receptor subunit TctC